MSDRCFIVTIDGPSGAGKSTVARRVAERLGFRYLDSGALYRALALAALQAGTDVDDPAELAELLARVHVELDEDGRVLLDGRDVSREIRDQQVGQMASRMSAFPAVRKALIGLQRAAARAPGIVAEGRDMGTVVFPHAELKIFLDATLEERARRRAAELHARGVETPIQSVREEIRQRDLRDRERELAPLRAAPDAIVLDSTGLGIDEVVALIVAHVTGRGAETD